MKRRTFLKSMVATAAGAAISSLVPSRTKTTPKAVRFRDKDYAREYREMKEARHRRMLEEHLDAMEAAIDRDCWAIPTYNGVPVPYCKRLG